jgi:transposase
MEPVVVVGVDLAKSVFQVHGVDRHGAVVLRRRVSGSQFLKLFQGLPSCLVGMEACSSAHFWARQLMSLGHEVKLMPAQTGRTHGRLSQQTAAQLVSCQRRAVHTRVAGCLSGMA